MATPIAMIPCVKSAVANGARMPTATNAIQNASAFRSHIKSAHQNTATKRRGLRSTLNPFANDTRMTRPRASNAGATRRANSSNNEMICAGKNTIR